MFAIQKASDGIDPLCKSAYPGGPPLNTTHNTVEGFWLILWLQFITQNHFNSTNSVKDLIQQVLT